MSPNSSGWTRRARAGVPWKKWGPYLSERQWGTVREDYSDDGNAWDYFSHDQARSRAYRWGEDGLAGISDDKQRLCFALALWNGRDPILKERLFGLTNSEGNHGEDVKEYYFYLDSTPTHSYMKYLYKYPQAAFPYERSRRDQPRPRRATSSSTSCSTPASSTTTATSTCSSSTRRRRRRTCWSASRCTTAGRKPAQLHVLPTLWFRNTWSWGDQSARKPVAARSERAAPIEASHPELGERYLLTCEGAPELLFTENETNAAAAVAAAEPRRRTSRTRFTTYVVARPAGRRQPGADGHQGGRALRARRAGRAAARSSGCGWRATAPAGRPFGDVRRGVHAAGIAGSRRVLRADHAAGARATDERRVMRQALAGMLWTQAVLLLRPRPLARRARRHPLIERTRKRRANAEWFHMLNGDIISMPDKWEYPWYAAWDLAFHTIALALVDLDFAKDQLLLMLREPLLAPERPDPGLRVELQRRQPAGARLGDALLYQHGASARAAADMRVPGALVPRAAAQLQLVGEPQGPARAATSSTAASSASTTSASSIAARRCRPAATSSRPTAPPGWRSSARTCSRSR